MYEEKNYFYYKKFSELLFLLILPFMFFAIGVYMIIYTPYPLIFGSIYGLCAIIIGFSRFLSGMAMKKYQQFNISKALQIMRLAVRWVFVLPNTKLFYAFLLILKKEYKEAEEVINKLKDKDLVYADEAKLNANLVLLKWKADGDLDGAYELIKKKVRKGCDESIHYVVTRIYLEKQMYRETRTYIEKILSSYSKNKGLLQNIVIGYFHTTQYQEAKLHFRNLYYDLNGANKDVLYYMGKLKMIENKEKDGNEFFNKALEFEDTSIDLVDNYKIKEAISI